MADKVTAADPRDGLPELPQPSLLHVNEPREFYTADQMRAYAEQCLAHARHDAVDERVVRQVAIAINYAWIGVDGSARHWWAQLGSNERKHKDDVARTAIAAYHEWEKRVWRRGYDDARLAADQQKGGGEVDRERTLTAARFRAACYALKEAVEGASGEVWRSESGERLKDRAEWVAFYNLTSNMRERGGPDPYATPQPSIPAPAQQDGKASGGEVDDAMVERACIAYYEQPAWAFMSHKAACKDRMRAALTVALAHPPHADQETQG